MACLCSWLICKCCFVRFGICSYEEKRAMYVNLQRPLGTCSRWYDADGAAILHFSYMNSLITGVIIIGIYWITLNTEVANVGGVDPRRRAWYVGMLVTSVSVRFPSSLGFPAAWRHPMIPVHSHPQPAQYQALLNIQLPVHTTSPTVTL